MITLKLIALFIFLFAFGYLLLKEGLHIDIPKEKMLKANARTTFKHYPKSFIVFVGAALFICALYLAFRLLF